jgi:DNA-directed RNA polymerase I, II, and III subunit RPABC2
MESTTANSANSINSDDSSFVPPPPPPLPPPNQQYDSNDDVIEDSDDDTPPPPPRPPPNQPYDDDDEVAEDSDDDAPPPPPNQPYDGDADEVDTDTDADDSDDSDGDGDELEYVTQLIEVPQHEQRGQSNMINSDIDDMDDDDDDDENYLQKFDESLKTQVIADHHPEMKSHNYDEIINMSKVTRNVYGAIIDPLHRSVPFITRYEKAKIIGERAAQLGAGAQPFIEVDENIIDDYIIASKEFEEKKIPFIIKRPMPNGGCEYWRMEDLEIIM